MSEHGKKHAAASKPGAAAKETRSDKAGLQFPVDCVYRLLHRGSYSGRVSPGAAICLAAVLEYPSVEILELRGSAARARKKARMLPRHIQLAVRNDDELDKFFSCVTVAQGGLCPTSFPSSLPRKPLEMLLLLRNSIASRNR